MSSLPVMVALLQKSLRQQRRDALGFAITVLTAPFFVAFYGLVYGEGAEVPFERYVPSLLVFAVIMLIFSTSMAISREIEQGTLERLRLAPVGAGPFLVATSLMQGGIGAVSVALSFAVAVVMGFESAGSLALGFLVTVVAGLACVGVGVWVASLARSVSQAFVMASVAMFLLLLFSGAVFPLPTLPEMDLWGRRVGPLDVLPTVHAVRALAQVLMEGRTMGEISGALGAMGALSGAFFGAGWWRLGRRQGNFLVGKGR